MVQNRADDSLQLLDLPPGPSAADWNVSLKNPADQDNTVYIVGIRVEQNTLDLRRYLPNSNAKSLIKIADWAPNGYVLELQPGAQAERIEDCILFLGALIYHMTFMIISPEFVFRYGWLFVSVSTLLIFVGVARLTERKYPHSWPKLPYKLLSNISISGQGSFPLLQLIVLFALFLTPALVNGFPFYFSDSGEYAGDLTRLWPNRSAVPGYVASPLFTFFGAWSLPIVNSLLTAYTLVQIKRVYSVQGSTWFLLIASIAAAIPIYTSLIMPDVWFVPQILAIILLLKRFNLLDFVIACICSGGHGANVPILILVSPVIIMVTSRKLRALFTLISVLSVAIILSTVLDRVSSREWFPKKYAWSIVASKLLSEIPEVGDDLCNRELTEKFCEKRYLLEETPRAHTTDYFIFGSPIGDPDRGGLERDEMNETGKKFLTLTLRYHLPAFVAATLNDWISMYRSDRCVDFSGYEDKSPENWYIRFLIDADHGVLRSHPVLDSKTFCQSVYVLNLLLMGAAVSLMTYLLTTRQWPEFFVCLILLVSAICNDLLFAALSGPFPRYQIRSLGLYAIIATFGISALGYRAKN
jgi:hypothetical protein